jgi:hypothetical protein
MFELFANPLNMMVGGALISSPIIIHLINRMRFKRVRWAAMEFLLKSQKRNRRRLIIEQLILLLLRILLVVLTGLLLARFLGYSFAEFKPRNTVHLILLDDRLSMTDQWKGEDGSRKNAFLVGKQVIEKEIAKNALLNRSAQQLVLLRLADVSQWMDQQRQDSGTELAVPAVFNQRLNDDTMKQLSDSLAKMEECTQLHLDMTKGIEAAREILGRHATDQRTLYIVSDFRQKHWFEPEATALLKLLDGLGQANVKIQLVDVADPRRSENQRVPLHHDNLAIVELRPEMRVAARNNYVQFKVAVANYGTSERKNIRVTVKVNGTEKSESSVPMPSVPPGKPTEAVFNVSFNDLGFNLVTAGLENEEYGVPGDNVRYAVMEVRNKVPILMIDGDPNGDKPDGDTYHLRTLFNAAQGYEVLRGSVNDLERPNLSQYACIYLLNVAELKSDKQVQNLFEYVKEGGGVGFFMGDQVKPAYYDKFLYADGTGIFPVPLAGQPTRQLTEEERQEKVLQNLTDPQMQVFVRDDEHPLFQNTEIKKYRSAFNFLNIGRYFPVPRQRWKMDDPSRFQELMTLPNNKPIGDYEGSAQQLLSRLPVDEEKYAKYKPGLEAHRRAIAEKLGGKSLHALAAAFDALLHDRGIENDPAKPSMVEFWSQTEPALHRLRTDLDKFREAIQLGDPFMVACNYGKGRTVAVLTTAGKKWNDWAGGNPAAFTYPVIMLEMQKYLASLGSEGNLTVGAPRQFDVDATRYDAEMGWYLMQEQAADNKEAAKQRPAPSKQSGTESGGRLRFGFDRTQRPGVYVFQLMQKAPEAGGQPRVEERAYAFNVDTANESDLRRASKNELERIAPTAVKVQAPGGGLAADVSDHKSDLSESAWFYLLFLLILVAEQALAVHLSFHLRDEGVPLTSRQPRAAAA